MSNNTEPHAEAGPPADETDENTNPPARTKLVAATILAVAALFGGAVVFGGLWLTGQWDGPSADDPAESVDGFLTALFTEHDAKDAASYTCASQSGDLGKVVDELDDAAAAAQFSWSKVTTVETDGSSAVVTAKVTHDVSGESAVWTFALVTGDPDDAWRVCGVITDDKSKS
ncbi:hypothetical protein [Stackebrandtia nassauensis]|uniref:Uncharacterized protein n=1 Tax=Stackebrandtia nassauensis (strain DSM 44728 / CIP 108903 / NRRL B-16338 / NBRC 102104 / LLR-40K-21) TaxID=446470 RepID=D3QA58_STANL|nr:hypothetical protein [Stackebrandtia nassauensis]ADD40770.1 hypothetical protein Snas_1060 [Stackebrandtia nassauensis DSM 44728]